MRKNMKLRWGICGAGKISSDFCAALKTLPEHEHEITAIGSMSMERSKAYQDKFGIKKAYSSYIDISNDPDIDIVYVGVMHQGHYPLTKLMLNAGKHVLCEKPLCLNLQQARELSKLAKEKNRFMMEAVWSRAFPIYKKIKEDITSGVLGDIQLVTAAFCFGIDHPLMYPKDGLCGALLTFGMYTIQFANWVFNNEKPEKIIATSSLSDAGSDKDGTIILSYKKGAKASLVYSAKCNAVNSGMICGTKGKIHIPDTFWCPIEADFPSGKMATTLPEAVTPYYYENSAGLRFEADLVRKCIMEGKLECPEMSHADTDALFAIMDEVRRQTGQEHDPAVWCDDSKWIK